MSSCAQLCSHDFISVQLYNVLLPGKLGSPQPPLPQPQPQPHSQAHARAQQPAHGAYVQVWAIGAYSGTQYLAVVFSHLPFES